MLQPVIDVERGAIIRGQPPSKDGKSVPKVLNLPNAVKITVIKDKQELVLIIQAVHELVECVMARFAPEHTLELCGSRPLGSTRCHPS